MSTDEDYRIRSDPRKDPRSSSYDSGPAKRPVPDNGEYVPSTIDKYMKGSMDKDEVLKKLRSDLFESGNSPAKAKDPRRASPQGNSKSNPYGAPGSPPSPAFQKDEPPARRKDVYRHWIYFYKY